MPDNFSPEERMQKSLDETIFFSTNPDKQKKGDDVYYLPIAKLVPFSHHPFKMYTGEKLVDMAESIKERGVVCPVVVRKTGDDYYEIIAGHNRVEASKINGADEIPAIIREVDDDTATLIMIESNLNQRENILPSERGQAYKLQLETMKKQSGRREKNGSQIGNHSLGRSSEALSEQIGESKNQIFRHIRLTFLIPDLSDIVDDGKLNFTYGVDLSYLSPEHQQTVYELIQDKKHKLTAANVGKLKELAKSEDLDDEKIEEIISVTNPSSKAPSVKRTVTKIMKQYRLPANRVNDFIQTAVEMFVQTERYRKEFDASG